MIIAIKQIAPGFRWAIPRKEQPVFRRGTRRLLIGGAAIGLLASLFVPHRANAVEAIPVGDAYVHTAFPHPTGAKGLLRVNGKCTTFFQYNVTAGLPDNTTADQIEKATLKFYLRKVPRGG